MVNQSGIIVIKYMKNINLTKNALKDMIFLVSKMNYGEQKHFNKDIEIEAEKILCKEHQYFTSADVIRVYNELK